MTNTMTLDASGRLGTGGVTSPAYALDVGNSASGNMLRMTASTTEMGGFISGGTPFFGAISNHAFVLMTNSTERARITDAGYGKFSNNGTYVNSAGAYHELYVSGAAADWTVRLTNATSTAANCYGMYIKYNSAAPNGTGNDFFVCEDNSQTRASIRSNGGLANYQTNDVNLSDERTKKDIAPLGSMWDKIKAIEIVTFKYKDQTHDDDNIGAIAQQVESVAPEFVDVDGFGETPEDGVPLKSIYTADMYHAAIKALQEAMTRIEKLEAEVLALKGA
jgi:hypothetical protein